MFPFCLHWFTEFVIELNATRPNKARRRQYQNNGVERILKHLKAAEPS